MPIKLYLTVTIAVSLYTVQFPHGGIMQGRNPPEQMPVPVHESWISRHNFHDPSSGARCCNEHDCSALKDEQVQMVGGGYLIANQYFVPHKRILPSNDSQYWVCYDSGGPPHRLVREVRCFFAPMNV